MSDFTFSCPKCKTDILCDESYAGTQIDCPTCSAKLKVPSATATTPAHSAHSNQKVTGPPARNPGKRNKPQTELSEVNLKTPIVVAAAVGLLPTIGLALSVDLPENLSLFWTLTAVFLFFFGAVLGLITGVMYLVRVFRISMWWGWALIATALSAVLASFEGPMSGMFSLMSVLGTVAGLVFLVMHWSKIWKLWLTNLGASILMIGSLFIFGFGLMTSLGINLSEGFDEMAFSESVTAGSNEDPRDAFYGFSQAMEQGDYPVAFSHLTPESQVAMIAMPVLAVSLEQAFSGKSGTKSPNMVKVESVFAKQGVSIKPEDIGENSFNNVADKGQLFQELVDAVPSLFDDIDEDMPSGALVAVTITGNAAKGVVDGEDIHFKQIGGSWLVDLAAMEEDEGFTIEMGELDFGDSFSRPRRSSKATPTEVESKVVQFHTAKAHAGNPSSQYEIGMRYLRGDGVEQNNENAADWLGRAAEQGHTRATKELASLQDRLKLQAESEARMKARLAGTVEAKKSGYTTVSLADLESGPVSSTPVTPTDRLLDLDGVNSFAELPRGIFSDMNEATIECWVKWDRFQNSSRVFDFVIGNQPVAVMNRGNTATLWAETFISGKRRSLQAPGILRLNQWTHIALVSGRNQFALYADGKLVQRGSIVEADTFRSSEFSRSNLLGRSNAKLVWPDDQDLDGQLNDVRVWNRIRTPDEIKAGMNSRITGTEPGLVGFWNFDDQANPGRDLSSGNHHGQLKGSASVTSGSHLQQL